MKTTAVLLCAGASRRMGHDKLIQPICGVTPIVRCIRALVDGGADEIAFVVSDQTREACEKAPCGVPKKLIDGGQERRDSDKNALDRIDCDVVVIHDAARPLASAALVRACIDSAMEYGSGVAAIPVTDTLVRPTDSEWLTVPRAGVYRTQTPQAFRLAEIRGAYLLGAEGCTDDAEVYAKTGRTARIVPGETGNIKLTSPEDERLTEQLLSGQPRYGMGYDTHRLVRNRKLILGGVTIPFPKGLDGHSDADVLLHAVMDALLGAAALGDIGKYFPPGNPTWLGADSRMLLRKVVGILSENGFAPVQVDATVICEQPKLAPFIGQMRENIAADTGVNAGNVSVKATTTEGMHDEGRGRCITAQAVAVVRETEKPI